MHKIIVYNPSYNKTFFVNRFMGEFMALRHG